MTRFTRFQTPKTAATDSSTHILGESTRRGVLSEGDGTRAPTKTKDKRFSGGSAPPKSLFSSTFTFDPGLPRKA